MNVPIAVKAAFSASGQIIPIYVQLENEAYKIHEIEYTKEEIFAGISTVRFCCYIERNGELERLMIRFHRSTTQWVLLK